MLAVPLDISLHVVSPVILLGIPPGRTKTNMMMMMMMMMNIIMMMMRMIDMFILDLFDLIK